MSDPTPHPLATLPGFAWITRHTGAALIALSALLAVILLVFAVSTWGAAALGLTALAAVPFVFAVLIAITIGK